MFWLTLLVMPLVLLMSCATPETYSVPPNLEDYAIIDDDAHSKYLGEDSWRVKKTARIISVDRVKVAYKRKLITPQMAMNMKDVQGVRFDKSIPLSPGEHKLLVEVCEGPGDNPFEVVVLPTSIRKCARTVFRLDAESNGRYRLAGSVSRSNNYADIWIEDLKDGTLAVDKVRIKGLSPK